MNGPQKSETPLAGGVVAKQNSFTHQFNDSPPDVQLPVVLVRAVWHAPDRVWLLKIAACPFCGRRHMHGGGSDPAAPTYGTRLSHCGVRGPARDYRLVPDVGVQQ